MAPKVFISYSHENEHHKKWVLNLATDLRKNGVDVVLDQWDLRPGQDIGVFMEYGVVKADRVIIVCTKKYFEKANKGRGGVGYEKMIVNKALVENVGTNKFIPIIRSNEQSEIPSFLGARLYIDFNVDENYTDRFSQLLREIHNAQLPMKPQLGPNPFAEKITSNPENSKINIPKVIQSDETLGDNELSTTISNAGHSPSLLFDDLGIDSPLWSRNHYLRFSLANNGTEVVFVEEINLNILSSNPSKKIHCPCEGAIWKPFELSVELSPDKRKYSLTEKIFFYRSGDIDGFSVKMSSKKNFTYEIQLEFIWHKINDTKRNILNSPIYTVEFEIWDVKDALSSF